MLEDPGTDRAAFAAALDLPADADEAAIVAAIGAMRKAAALLSRIATLDLPRVRDALGLPASASALDCAAALVSRLPPSYAAPAVTTMQLVERREQLRAVQVREILREALRP